MSRLIKPTILSLSLLTVMSGAAVAPALAEIAAAFPEASFATIKLILTLPAIFIIIFSLVSGWLSHRFSKRHVIFLGLFFYIFGGVGAGLTNSIESLLVFRALLGVGVGLIMPLSTGLIADFYSGQERVALMGNSTAASNLGGIIATMIAGILASISWRYSFGVYLLGFLVLIMVIAFLPEPQPKEIQNKVRQKLPKAVYGWAGGAFLLMLGFYAIPVNLAIFIEENGLGGAPVAGLAISLITASGFLGGISFARIKKITRSFLPSLLFAIMALGYFILSFAINLNQVFIGGLIVGLGLGWSLPALYIGATKAGGDGFGVQTMAVVSSMAFLGQFMSPIVLTFMGNVLGNSSSRFVFYQVAICFAVLLLAAIIRLPFVYFRNAKERGVN